MRTHLEFHSAQLRDAEEDGNSYNPHIYGRKLSEFLSQEFRAIGYSGNVIEEDWGWMVELANDPFTLWLGCASYESDESFLVFINPSKPAIWRWFRKIDTQLAVAKIAEQLEAILLKNGSATNLKWWSDKESGRN